MTRTASPTTHKPIPAPANNRIVDTRQTSTGPPPMESLDHFPSLPTTVSVRTQPRTPEPDVDVAVPSPAPTPQKPIPLKANIFMCYENFRRPWQYEVDARPTVTRPSPVTSLEEFPALPAIISLWTPPGTPEPDAEPAASSPVVPETTRADSAAPTPRTSVPLKANPYLWYKTPKRWRR